MPTARRSPVTDELEASRGSLTRKRILDAAQELFHRNGMNSTTLGDVLRASGTGKGQFYQHFASREQLAEQVVLRYRDFMVALATTKPFQSWEALREFLFGRIPVMEKFGFVRGCPIGTAGYALGENQEAVRLTLEVTLAAMCNRIEAFLSSEQANGRLAKDAVPARLAAFTIGSMQGSMLLALVSRSAVPLTGGLIEVYAHLQSFVVAVPEPKTKRISQSTRLGRPKRAATKRSSRKVPA